MQEPSTEQRYHVVEGRARIELTVRDVRRLFDSRDPAPFRERDLDEGAVEYVMGAVEEIPRHLPLALVVAIDAPPDPALPDHLVAEAIRSHFTHARRQVARRLRHRVRRGRLALGVGLLVLVACLTLAQAASSLPAGYLRDVAREGLVIAGWVAMWRPIEVLLYDWWPLVDERRQVDRVLDAAIEIRHADGIWGATAPPPSW
ncbi:MAG: hypothetical protein AB7H93_12405 [Vicinamibacterales bacterium]